MKKIFIIDKLLPNALENKTPYYKMNTDTYFLIKNHHDIFFVNIFKIQIDYDFARFLFLKNEIKCIPHVTDKKVATRT